MLIFLFKQKTAYEMRISDGSSDVCSSDRRQVGQHDGEASARHLGQAADEIRREFLQRHHVARRRDDRQAAAVTGHGALQQVGVEALRQVDEVGEADAVVDIEIEGDGAALHVEVEQAGLAPLLLQRLGQTAAGLHGDRRGADAAAALQRSEEHTSELQSLMRHSYAVFCLKKKKKRQKDNNQQH